MKLNIGEIIIAKRKEKSWTQEQLADAVGVSAPAVSKWETGTTYPDITLLSPIARALNTTVDELLSYQNELSSDDVNELTKRRQGLMKRMDLKADGTIVNPPCRNTPTAFP